MMVNCELYKKGNKKIEYWDYGGIAGTYNFAKVWICMSNIKF